MAVLIRPILVVLAVVALLVPASAARAEEKPAGLHIEVHEAARPNGTLMLLLSGDAGWGALEQAVTDGANRAGINVIGLNSRRYFFSGSSPKRLANDVQSILAFYGKQWRSRSYILAGYSFGADALPFAWKYLPIASRDRTDLIALIGLQPAANFSISIWEMLDLPASDDVPVALALGDLPLHKVLCIHGVDDGAACGSPGLKRSRRVVLAGGHDFAGNYQAVADAILRAIRHRK